MRATARRSGEGYTHEIEIGRHQLVVDEPEEKGGADAGPAPHDLLAASLAGCVAITLEMYAARKGWDLGQVQVHCDFEPPPPGEQPEFDLQILVSGDLAPDQLERLEVIAGKCPVHRMLERGARFTERIVQADPTSS